MTDHPLEDKGVHGPESRSAASLAEVGRPATKLLVARLDQLRDRNERVAGMEDPADRFPFSGTRLGRRDDVEEPVIPSETVALVAKGEAQEIQMFPAIGK